MGHADLQTYNSHYSVRSTHGLAARPLVRSPIYTLLLAAGMSAACAELLWVYGPGEQRIPAFTDFGLECLTIRGQKSQSPAVKRAPGCQLWPALRGLPLLRATRAAGGGRRSDEFIVDASGPLEGIG